MRISETHKNGARIEVSGWRAHKVIEAWRKTQDALESDDEPEGEKEPKVKGMHGNAERAGRRYYESEAAHSQDVPIVFGFVPNEVNERINK